jgi:hypothetical protein
MVENLKTKGKYDRKNPLGGIFIKPSNGAVNQ